ncbi:hypothetical protein D3C84_1075020 [compost metagenome]
MAARGNQHPRTDLPGIGRQFQTLVTEQRIDRHHPDLQQRKEHHIELGDIGQLHQRRVTATQAALQQMAGQAVGLGL